MKINSETTVYIAGPMTGCCLLNYPAFFAMEGMLKKEFNCSVLNPARQPNGLSYEEYMKRAFEDLKKADAVVLLNGWNDSQGATMEFEKAREASINLFFEEEIYMIINRKLQKENPTIRIKDRKNAALQL